MATPQVNRAQPPPPPVAMATPAPGASTNQNAPSAQSQGAVTQEQVSVASSQQFIPPGMNISSGRFTIQRYTMRCLRVDACSNTMLH